MRILLAALTGLIAFLHLFFLILEMFLWQTPYGMKTFHLTPELAQGSAVLAANQGLYNGFLSAGLIWSLLIGEIRWALNVRTFFLGCVLVAGVYGGVTAQRSILLVQALPALVALSVLVLYRRSEPGARPGTHPRP